MGSTQVFISKFHHLTGVTVGERRKNLFQLLKTFSDTDINFSLLCPENPLEEVFKVECLIYYKKTADLVDVLKSDNPILIDKVLKIGPSFIRNAFNHMSGNDLANDFFPSISYNTKLKLIHKFSLHLTDADKADEYFKAIEEKYGVYLAAKMLSCCSERVIIKCVEENRVEIVPRHMLKILERFPSVAEDLFATLNLHNYKLGVSEKYTWVFLHLAKTNIHLCLQLWEKFRPDFYVGARATRTVIKNNKDDFMSSPRKYVNFLRKSEIGKTLKNSDFNGFFSKVFPTTIAKVNDAVNVLLLLLKHLKVDSDKLSLFLDTFRNVHHREMWDFPVFVRPELLGLMKAEEREIFIDSNDCPGHITSECWISFMKCEKSLPLLKEKLQTATFFLRMELCKSLVKTCAINQDLTALLEVLIFIKQQNLRIQADFLTSLIQTFDFSLFGEEHWEHLNNYVELFKKTGSLAVQSKHLFGQYIRYCVKRNVPIQELLISWTSSTHTTYSKYSICAEDPKCEKICLEAFAKMEPRDFPSNSFVDYLDSVNKWNKRYPKNTIKMQLKESALEVIKKTLEQEQAYPIIDVAEQCIYDYFQESRAGEILNIFFKRKFYNNHLRVSTWLLKYHPLVFLGHIVDITNNLLQVQEVPLHFRNVFKYYTHLNIPRTMQDVCLSHAHKEKGAMVWLSLLVDAKEFNRLCCQDQYKDLIVYLKNVSSLPDTLDLVQRFCAYDHLKYVQRPLYLAAYNVNEIKLVPFFESLIKDCDVQIKKHVIFLIFKVLPKQVVLAMLDGFLKEQNHLITKYVFKGIFNLFIRSPNDKLWDLTQSTVEYLNQNDMEVFRILSNYRRIPNRYFVRYLKLTWFKLENILNVREDVTLAKCRILDSLTIDKLSIVPEDFCLDVIKKHLFEDLDKSVISFTCRFIISKPRYVETVFDILKDFERSASWSDRKKTMTLVEEVCDNFIDDSNLPKEILENFIRVWDNGLKPQESFHQYLRLHFTLIYINCKDDTLTRLGETLSGFCDSLNENLFDIEIFVEHFSFFKNRIYSTYLDFDSDMVNLMLIESILNSSSSNSCLLFAINLLPKNKLNGKAKSKYESIVESLGDKLNPIASVYFYNHLTCYYCN